LDSRRGHEGIIMEREIGVEKEEKLEDKTR